MIHDDEIDCPTPATMMTIQAFRSVVKAECLLLDLCHSRFVHRLVCLKHLKFNQCITHFSRIKRDILHDHSTYVNPLDIQQPQQVRCKTLNAFLLSTKINIQAFNSNRPAKKLNQSKEPPSSPSGRGAEFTCLRDALCRRCHHLRCMPARRSKDNLL